MIVWAFRPDFGTASRGRGKNARVRTRGRGSGRFPKNQLHNTHQLTRSTRRREVDLRLFVRRSRYRAHHNSQSRAPGHSSTLPIHPHRNPECLEHTCQCRFHRHVKAFRLYVHRNRYRGHRRAPEQAAGCPRTGICTRIGRRASCRIGPPTQRRQRSLRRLRKSTLAP